MISLKLRDKQMYRGQFVMFADGKGFGFIASPEFPDNVFAHTKSIHLPPGEFPSAGDECTFDVGHDRLGRPVANNIRITSRALAAAPAAEAPARAYIDYPGRRRQYLPSDPSDPGDAPMSGRARRARDRGAEERDRIWSKPGDDEI
jgi:cold shock CspA family protein